MNIDDRMKMYEKEHQPKSYKADDIVILRLDGRGFSKFTSKMNKPFDSTFTEAMQNCAEYLMKEFNAIFAYQQSDEISLVLINTSEKSDFVFGGKVQKLVSTSAGLCSAKFYSEISKRYPDLCTSKMPHFDCRTFTVPNLNEAANVILWRFQDATRNSTSMMGRAYYTHKQMHQKTTEDVRLALIQDHNVDWNKVHKHFTQGTFFKKESYINSESGATRHRYIKSYENFSTMTSSERVNMIVR